MRWQNLARIRECSDSNSTLISRVYNSPTDGSVNRSISTGQLVRPECKLRNAVLHDIHSEAASLLFSSLFFSSLLVSFHLASSRLFLSLLSSSNRPGEKLLTS